MNETTARCHYCHQTQDNSIGSNGFRTRELMPYGPGGGWICFQCMKADLSGEREREAERQLELATSRIRAQGLTPAVTEEGIVPFELRES